MHFSEIRFKKTTLSVEPVHMLMNNKVFAHMTIHYRLSLHLKNTNIYICTYVCKYNNKFKKLYK